MVWLSLPQTYLKPEKHNGGGGGNLGCKYRLENCVRSDESDQVSMSWWYNCTEGYLIKSYKGKFLK